MSHHQSKWRRISRGVIESVLRANPDDAPLDKLIEQIDAKYPFSERRYWPYKMWCKERRAFIDSRTPVGVGLERDCPACGAKRGKQCRGLVEGTCESRNVRPSGPLFGEVSP